MVFDPGNISASNTQTLWSSKTTITLTQNVLRVTSDGDPWPAISGEEWIYSTNDRTFGVNTNKIKDKNFDFKFIYRAGQNTQNPQKTPGINSIFTNGVIGFAPVIKSIPGTESIAPANFSFNSVFFGSYFGIDLAGGYPSASGTYRYLNGNMINGMSYAKFITSNGYYKDTEYENDNLRHRQGHSKILGFALDGYPIYGPYGYSQSTDKNSLVRHMKSGYMLLPKDNHRPDNMKYTDSITINNEDVKLVAGSFVEDYYYIKTRGDLDEHNGRYCVTPDFPDGTYAYFLTFEDEELQVPAYPYIIGPTTKQKFEFVEDTDEGDQFTKPSIWDLQSGVKISNLVERRQVSIRLPISNYVDTSKVTISLISGNLPAGCRIEGVYIVGTTYEVQRDTLNKFTLRAYYGDEWEDRTYEIVVVGPDEPQWITNEGMLPVGNNNRLFILDNQIIDYQLMAFDTDISAGDELEYFIAEGDGDLPPGVSLTEDGRLTGIVEPLLALDQATERGGYDDAPYAGLPLDFASLPNNGFDSYFYDIETYGYADESKQVKKLNRYYPFRVTVTDGDSFVTREFKIYLVGDDYLLADNTLMQTGNGVFTADNTNVRTPEWITPKDLGFIRADNYTIIPIQSIENNQLEGIVRYTLEDINDDGTTSMLPNGLTLDSYSGTVYGYLPYQSAVVKDNKFTIRATRTTFDLETVQVFGTYYEDVLLGNNSFKIYKTDLTGLDDGINDLLSLRGRQILLGNRSYNVINVDASNDDYDIIFLDDTLAPDITLRLTQQGLIGNNYIFVDRLNDKQKEKYKESTLAFKESEKYVIKSITPYIEYDVVQITPENDPIFPYGAPEEIKIGENYFDGDYVIYPDTLGGNNFIYVCTEAHATTASLDNDGNFILGLNGQQLVEFQSTKWSQVAENVESLSEEIRFTAVRQAIESLYGTPVFISVKSQNVWNLKLPSTSLTRVKQNIEQFFTGTDSSSYRIDLIRDNEDRVLLDRNLKSNLNQGRNIGIALFQNDFFSKNIIISERDEVDIPSSTRTFELKTIGEVDSTIKWLTDSNLGSIPAELQSTISIRSESTVPDTKMVYVVTQGKLPNGMYLTYDGELIGIPKQYASNGNLGLTYFETGVSWDGELPGDTTFDRDFRFTVAARDRFNYSTISREFVLNITDNDKTLYTKVYMKPMLNSEERAYVQQFTSNYTIFEQDKLYRPQDPEFGVQKDLELLIYAGIEAKNIDEFAAAASQNHKRKKYLLGDIQTAIAKTPGTNDILYEVIYIPVVDPANGINESTRNSFRILTKKEITVDSILYNTKDDVTSTGIGNDVIPIYGRNTVKFVSVNMDEVRIDLRNSLNIDLDVDNQDFEIEIRGSSDVTVELQKTDSEPYKIAPTPTNTIKIDSDAIKVSQSKDNIRYISNLDNMRNNIKKIGTTSRSYLPLWMRTPQEGLQELDYIPAIPLCYCKPGQSAEILRNLRNANFDPSQINYDIDRYIVKNANNIDQPTYILFANYQFNV